MNTTHNTKTKRLIAAVGAVAAAAVAPALLFAGAGTAHADPCAPFTCIGDDDLGSVTAPGNGSGGGYPTIGPGPYPGRFPESTYRSPAQDSWDMLPQCNIGDALFGGCGD